MWSEFHAKMINLFSEQLLDTLPQGYDAPVDKHTELVEVTPDSSEEWDAIGGRRPDVALVKSGRSNPSDSWAGDALGWGEAEGGVAVATCDPVTVRVPRVMDERIERWVEVRWGRDRELIAVIELLSPTNKTGSGRVEYQKKRRSIIEQGVHLLEVDLLLGGRRVEDETLLPPGECMAVLTRAGRPDLREVYAWPLRRPLPTVPVPLRPPDGDVGLDLAEAFAEAYRRGRYWRRLPYGAEADPLSRVREEDRAWAAERVGEAVGV